ncbi:MAG: type II secretion system F family protein [Parcubacteria group bacterium]|nr:type II secretion system F family protein [Parcubacteria group bacterium]
MYFNYKAKNPEGEMISGIVEAESEEEAASVLLENQLTVVSLSVKKTSVFQLQILSGVPSRDVVIMARQLSVMVSANVPIVEAMRILVDQTANLTLRGILSHIADDVEGGARLSLSLSKYPKVFSNFFVAMIRSGETSGKLADVLNYLADQLEKDHDLMSRIKGAMIYPVFLMAGLLAVGIIMMVFVVPKITSILRETGTALPVSTRMLIAVSDFFVGYWWLVIASLIGVVIGIRVAWNYPSGKKIFDTILLRLPLFGNLMKRIYIVRFTQSLSTLITGKVPLSEALRVVSDVVGNSVYEELINETIREVEDGSPIATVFEKSPYMPIMVSQMLSVGEKTGKIDLVLEKITNFYRREIDSLVDNLVTLIEPIVMILMGIAVGVMVAAIILPMYNLAGSF